MYFYSGVLSFKLEKEVFFQLRADKTYSPIYMNRLRTSLKIFSQKRTKLHSDMTNIPITFITKNARSTPNCYEL